MMNRANMTSARGRSHTFDARADGFARGEGGYTALHYAAVFGQEEVALALIERGVDRWPRHMVEASEYRGKYFDAHGLSLWRTALDADGRRHVRAMKNIEDFVGKDYDTGLLSFFRALLTIDPQKRITAPQALRKSFVRQDTGS